jgi:glyceraldehyde 3-phosphate dehydrogenase
MLNMDLAPSKIDIGKLAYEWMEEGASFSSKADFFGKKLGGFVGAGHEIKPKDVVLYAVIGVVVAYMANLLIGLLWAVV